MQDGLASGHHRQGQRRAASPHLLTGRIRKARGRTMTPTHAQKGKLRFRSYVASSAAPVTSDVPVSALRITAPRIEAVVVGTWRGLIPPEDHARQPNKPRILWSLDPADQSIAAAQLAASSETEIAGLETQARIGVGHPIKRRERG